MVTNNSTSQATPKPIVNPAKAALQPLLSVEEVAEYMGVTKAEADRLIGRDIPCTQVGGTKRVRLDMLKAFLDEHTQQKPAQSKAEAEAELERKLQTSNVLIVTENDELTRWLNYLGIYGLTVKYATPAMVAGRDVIGYVPWFVATGAKSVTLVYVPQGGDNLKVQTMRYNEFIRSGARLVPYIPPKLIPESESPWRDYQ